MLTFYRHINAPTALVTACALAGTLLIGLTARKLTETGLLSLTIGVCALVAIIGVVAAISVRRADRAAADWIMGRADGLSGREEPGGSSALKAALLNIARQAG